MIHASDFKSNSLYAQSQSDHQTQAWSKAYRELLLQHTRMQVLMGFVKCTIYSEKMSQNWQKWYVHITEAFQAKEQDCQYDRIIFVFLLNF